MPRVHVFTLVALILGSMGFASAAELPNPQELGPYPVGVTTTVFVDHDRKDPATNGPRTLVTEIWYPAVDSAADLPKNKMSDFLFRGQAPTLLLAFRAGFQVNIDDIDAKFENIAVRDAVMRDGKFPLIVFSHGNGGIRFQSTFWCDHLASHGYVVVSADHTGNAAATVVNNKLVIHKPNKREQHAMDRPLDISFAIDRMTRWAKGEDSRFAGRIDLKKVAVAGHSFGGYTAGAIINTDKRVKAIIPMTPVFGERSRKDVPLLLILSGEDATIGLERNADSREYYEETEAPKLLVNVVDAGHFSFSDMAQFRPDFGDGVGTGERITKPGESITYLDPAKAQAIANAYSTAFLGYVLKGLEGYQPFLETNHYEDDVEFEAELAPAAAAASN